MLEAITQRSPEWYAKRNGKFTSSRINDLMGIKGLGKTGETYAFELAVDIVEGRNDDDFMSYDMKVGVETEPYAFDQFRQNKSIEFLEVNTCDFFELNSNTGGSPDGIVSDNSVLEIKCPKPNKLFRLVVDGLIDQVYIDQMQHQMWVTGCKQAYFFNYCIYNGEPKWHEIIVPRDQDRIDLMKVRINEAVILRDQFIDLLKSNRQY